MNIRIYLDKQKIEGKVTNDKTGLFISHEWHKLINPYTPRDTGELMENVDELPFKLHYKQNYARKMYDGGNFHYRRINPYSTDHWDIKAAEAGQLDKLYREINKYLRR